LVVTYDYPFDPKKAVLEAAGAHPLEVERENGTVAVTAAPGLEVKPTPVAEPLRVIDPTELAATDRALIARPVLLAYRYEGTNFSLALNVIRHDQVAGLEAVTDRAQLISVLTEQGEMLTQASFMVKNNERQYQRFQLPPGATLWGVTVNNEPVKADRDGEWILVSLPRSRDRDQTFSVDLNYAQQVGALGRLGGLLPRRLELVAPRTDAPGTYAEWELYTPPARRVAGFGGTMKVARGTLYGFRDGWDAFVQVYADLWHRFGAGLILATVFLGFLGSLWVLGRRKGVSGLMQVLVIFALLFVAAGMLLPALSKAKAKANRISSVNNLKNIGLAARIFATDHDGKLPPDFNAMRSELSTDRILVHPTTGEAYTWVGAGKSEAQPDALIAYGPVVEGQREVLFADGSVQHVTSVRFDELLAKELTASRPAEGQNRASVPEQRVEQTEESTTKFYQMDPILARRYGLAPRKFEAADQTTLPPLAQTAAAATAGKADGEPGAPALPTVAGLRSLKIDVPKTGRAFQFTRVLNLSEKPPTVQISVMSAKAFVVLRTLLQFAAFLTGLLILWRHWRRDEPSALWLAIGGGLALIATVSLFIGWRALHVVLIAGVPMLGLLLLLWALSFWWVRRRRNVVTAASTADRTPGPSVPGTDSAAGQVNLALLFSFLSWVSTFPATGDSLVNGANQGVRSHRVSVVGTTLVGTAGERVARLEATLEFSSAGTNQTVSLFGPEVAVQSFTNRTGEARLWRDGDRVGVLLPTPGTATVQLTLLVKLGGDIGRRTLDFGIPPALGTRLSLQLEEPDAEVEFPGAVSFIRTPAGEHTQLEAILGATERMALAWTPRLRKASETGATILAHEVALVTLGNGVTATRTQLDFTTPQGELRSLRVGIPAGQRVLRASGEFVRSWSYADPRRAEILLQLTKSAPRVQVILETEAPLEALPTSISVVLPQPLDVKRVTGLVAVRVGEELGLTFERMDGLERTESGEFGSAFGDAKLNVASAWRFLRTDFDLVVRAEVLTPRIESSARHTFQVGFEQVAVTSHLDLAVSRAGVFSLRLALPDHVRVDSVSCPAMERWTEQTDSLGRVLELRLKQRTLGEIQVQVSLVRTLTNLLPVLDLIGVHPLGVDTLNGYVSVAAEPGVGLKVSSRTALTEIPAAQMPGAGSGAGLLAFKQLAAEPGPMAAWTLSVAAEGLDSWVRAEVATVLTVGETRVTGRSLVRYEVQNAPLKEFRLRVPVAWRNVEITGAGVRRRDQTNSASGVEWRVELQNKVRGEYRLSVQWEELRTNSVALR